MFPGKLVLRKFLILFNDNGPVNNSSGGSTGGGEWGTGGSTTTVTRDAEPEPQEFGVGPGDVVITPGGGSTTPGDVWTIGPGGVVITHPPPKE